YPPRIILFVGDGMGEGQRTAARWYAVGEGGEMVMDAMPVAGLTGTTNVSNDVTDSAAAGTALATGVKTYNGAISVDVYGNPLTTILERAQAQGLAVGLVTNTPMSHATPATFAAHVASRSMMTEIARQMVAGRVNVLLGGGRSYFQPAEGPDLIAGALEAGYVYVEDADALTAVDPATTTHLLGLFADGGMARPFSPTLAEMTTKAIDILSQDPEGFFLMVEGGQIDWACHDNDAINAIQDTVGFDEAVAVGKAYAAETGNTLVIVTADHETGGMAASTTDNGGEPFQMPDGTPFYVTWLTNSHTDDDVPTTAQGPWSHLLAGSYENTYIHDVMRTALESPFRLTIEGASKGVTQTSYPFTATVQPPAGSLPFTLTWATADADPVIVTQGLSSTLTLSWTLATRHTITATAKSAETTLITSHTINLAQRWFDVYLPLVLRYNHFPTTLRR
ncbi:MAG: alkaline phosphatase, partial [Anaerolineae bacterium]